MLNQNLVAENKDKSKTLQKKNLISIRETKIKRGIALVEKLAGSVPIPEEWKERDIDEIIEEAKDEYFKEKYGKIPA
jgi:hypothetical protein